MDDQLPPLRTGWQRFVPPVLAFLLVAGLGYALFKPAAQITTDVKVDKPAPAFTLPALEGQKVALSDFAGRPVVLNFWASWCGPCREEAPLFKTLAEQKPNDVAVIGILFAEDKIDNARVFIKEQGLNYPNLRDTDQADTAVAYGVTGIPQTVFIDARGVVRTIERGELTREKFNKGLESIGAGGI